MGSLFNVRCFKGDKGSLRHGIWIMTRPDEPDSRRGHFIHGSHCETQAPRYTVEQLASGDLLIPVEEITPGQVIDELAGDLQLQDFAWSIFDSHRATVEAY